MARFDKVDPKDGSFRVTLGFAVVAGDVGKVIPIEVNGSGLAVKAAANSTAVRGVLCPTAVAPIGDRIDAMTDGEIVDVNRVGTTDVVGAVAGADIKAGASGVADAAGTGKSLGFMVEAWRLVVRLGRGT